MKPTGVEEFELFWPQTDLSPQNSRRISAVPCSFFLYRKISPYLLEQTTFNICKYVNAISASQWQGWIGAQERVVPTNDRDELAHKRESFPPEHNSCNKIPLQDKILFYPREKSACRSRLNVKGWLGHCIHNPQLERHTPLCCNQKMSSCHFCGELLVICMKVNGRGCLLVKGRPQRGCAQEADPGRGFLIQISGVQTLKPRALNPFHPQKTHIRSVWFWKEFLVHLRTCVVSFLWFRSHSIATNGGMVNGEFWKIKLQVCFAA